MSTFDDQSFLRRPVGALTRKDEYAEARARIFGEDRSTSKGGGSRRAQRGSRGSGNGGGGSGGGGNGGGKNGGKAGGKAGGKNGKNGKSNGADEPEPTGAILSLDEISYDRDMKWYNAPSDARPRPAMEKGGRAYSEIERITHDTSEHAELDEHYQALDRRKERRDREARSGKNGLPGAVPRGGPGAGDEIKILKPVGGGRRRQLPGESRGEMGERGERAGRGIGGEHNSSNLLGSRSIMEILTANKEKNDKGEKKVNRQKCKQRSARGKGQRNKKGVEDGGDNPAAILLRPQEQVQGGAQWEIPGHAQWEAQGQAQGQAHGYGLWSTPSDTNDDVGDFDNMLRDIGRARALDVGAAEWVPPNSTVGATVGVSPLVEMNTQAPEWVPPASTVVAPITRPAVPVVQQAEMVVAEVAEAEVAEVEGETEGGAAARGEVHDGGIDSADESDEEIVLNPGLDQRFNHSPPPAFGEYGVS